MKPIKVTAYALITASTLMTSTNLVAQDERPERRPPPEGGAPGGEPRPPLPPRELHERSPGAPVERDREREHGPGDRGPEDRGPRGEGRPSRGGGDPESREDRRGGRERWEQRANPPGREDHAQKPRPFLGVISVEVPAPVAAQLALPEGFGLLVEEVLPDSPAAAAGLQRYDVLKLLNDQQLASPSQLADLVRGLGMGTDASLTIVRKGQEQKLAVKIGERNLPDRSDRIEERIFRFGGGGADRFFGAERPDGRSMTGEGTKRLHDQMREFNEGMRRYQDAIREYQKGLEVWQKNPGAGAPPAMPSMPALPEPPRLPDRLPKPGRPGSSSIRPADILREFGPGGSDRVKVEWSDGDSRWAANHARLKMRDSDGELEVMIEDGVRTLVARNAQGDTVFTGPIGTPEQRNAVPEPYRGKLAALRPPPLPGDVVRSANPDQASRPVGADGPKARERFERRVEVQ